ncbi:SDR family NAD(P)-dependent oxidoreductase [Agrobacterium vitis]|uniref:SDR family NAD(P)-dependent oxidoreductase n=1 Tax=Agrobacterium vitis TaxID=373 RepID=UPI001574C95D|nr:SDR family NAD(P)-dependent oxidoreductase [Agrobacterium vitis]NSY14803.1 SDR family NAD(P)-dependent oxidoreductase [Agrobacterium vitis]NSY24560.1 SDR family NAD(P)-dependent oxidoreductase [Agrobacterium vitis]WEO75465.1 SDR family NAD(P)-dependent oxidoreductase [Agrobacterium vitis]
MPEASNKLAVVTGASSGIGLELAKIAAGEGYDLIIAADEDQIDVAADILRSIGVTVDAMRVDLSTKEGASDFARFVADNGQPVDLLLANAGRGLGKGFLDQDLDEALHVVNTNVIGTVSLIHTIANQMRARGHGKILITGSIAGFIPGTYQAVYNGTKAFLNSFSFALRHELKDTGVTVTCLMPGPTQTKFFERADMLDTEVGQAEKDDPADVAKAGFKALMNDEGDVVAGWKNKLQSVMANVTPANILAEQHAKMAAPGTGKD